MVPALVLFLIALAIFFIQQGMSPVAAHLLSGVIAAAAQRRSFDLRGPFAAEAVFTYPRHHNQAGPKGHRCRQGDGTMTTSRSDTSDFVGGLQDAIQKNPVSAALSAWASCGCLPAEKISRPPPRSSPPPPGRLRPAPQAACSVPRRSRAARARLAIVRRQCGRRRSRYRFRRAASAGDTATKAYEAVKDTAADFTVACISGPTGAEGFAGTLQQNLTDTFERQPLLLGAIGLAIGAGMAAAVPATQMETEMVGDAADRVKAQAAEHRDQRRSRR